MTAREALAYGRPVVATRVGGLADLDGGVRFADTTDEIRAAVAGLLEDQAARTAARAYAEAHLSPDAASRSLLELYERTKTA
jgi:glycosyltransferase involved in cell wall biosynthesis